MASVEKLNKRREKARKKMLKAEQALNKALRQQDVAQVARFEKAVRKAREDYSKLLDD